MIKRRFTNPSTKSDRKAKVIRLLTIALMEPKGWIKHLLRRLEEDGGGDLIPSLIRRGFFLAGVESSFHEDIAAHSLDEWVRTKNACKEQMMQGKDDDDRAASILGYFLSIAVARAHFGAGISYHKKKDLDDIFREILSILPPTWAQIVREALTAEAS